MLPMRLLASLLSRFEQMPGSRQTGLDGRYEAQLEWAPDSSVVPANLAGAPADRPSLVAAVQEQRGLQLEGRRAPLDVVVIQRPSRVPEPN